MFKIIFYNPLYNALVWLAGVIPGHDLGLAIIVLTILVKIILMPLYKKAIVTQQRMKLLEPEIKRIKEQYKDVQEQSRRMLELYQKNQLNPFASLVVVLIQIPIILALFWVFKDSFNFNPELLYSFIQLPEKVNVFFLGSIDITAKYWAFAALVGLTQFIQMRISLPSTAKPSGDSTFADDFQRSMNFQMKYFMPVLIAFVAASLPVAISLYWITSNIFSVFQEIFIRRKISTN